MLQLRDVCKSYAHGSGTIDVLHHLHLDIQKGERVAILGPSGSGKSTLLALLGGLDRPTSGQLLLDGHDLSHSSEEALTRLRARMISIVFQQFHLMSHLTALENVSLPLKILRRPDPTKTAAAALSQVGLGARLGHFPHEMSGGECQRTAIARAMVTRPSLLLADEPSGNLDTATGDQVMKLLFELVASSGTTLVLVTHNATLAAWCDRKLLLKGGQLHESAL